MKVYELMGILGGYQADADVELCITTSAEELMKQSAWFQTAPGDAKRCSIQAGLLDASEEDNKNVLLYASSLQ